MSFEVVISAKNLNKCFQIYDQPRDRLKQFLLPKIRKLLRLPFKNYFHEFWALRDISFDIKRGETVGIIGKNGSGKSTLLQIITGTLNPTSGSIEKKGRVAALLELGSGFNPEFTGRENVFMNGALFGLSSEEIGRRFSDIENFADIGEFIDQPVKTYSSGMMLRLAFAVVAHVDADILIVDEALSVGDALFTQKCMRFLRKFMKSGTVLFVSHDTNAVIGLCNRAILLNAGEVVEIGSPKDVTQRYLSMLYELNQDIRGIVEDEVRVESEVAKFQGEYRDMRESFINSSTLRNDIEIFQFDESQAGFGTGDAEIISVKLLDACGTPLSWVIGGERVILEIRSLAHKNILRPIVGFNFKDRLGQAIFVDNTYYTYQYQAPTIAKDKVCLARFEFSLPVLPSGDYSFTAAIADGTQENHVQLHWKHDALIIKVHSSSVCFGLIGVPMKNITLECS